MHVDLVEVEIGLAAAAEEGAGEEDAGGRGHGLQSRVAQAREEILAGGAPAEADPAPGADAVAVHALPDRRHHQLHADGALQLAGGIVVQDLVGIPPQHSQQPKHL